MWNFKGSLFLAFRISRGSSNTTLWNIQGLSFGLSGISRGKVKNEKFQAGWFSKKYSYISRYPQRISSTPRLDFFWNSTLIWVGEGQCWGWVEHYFQFWWVDEGVWENILGGWRWWGWAVQGEWGWVYCLIMPTQNNVGSNQSAFWRAPSKNVSIRLSSMYQKRDDGVLFWKK